ncbi:acyclic terpene utilization AtuA family protein [Streptomyces sp. NBC_01408]|uniref:acyclic terpene utilization AtuA family protein n=1 Tax=Streptomyces sp. NBC_01408 TaxID=2903855 RepID=UPI002259A639|nr:acyclic terpene utilization AtuA family protein [Streptomyces sp. NBC_01408]MCX4691788.1 acyclic terpene utilization AtuA family protein [Streptomyces sp. NBC_01408]
MAGRPTARRPLRIGNASGFYGDRFDALREMLTGGPLDVLTGDYLAELTMLILGRDRLKNPDLGYAKTFLRQLEEGLGLAHERGVRIVANAGGLNPAGLADAIRALAAKAGVPVTVAHVEGDDLMPYEEGALTANAYLGGAGITECLRAGADVVVTGRVTDAALVSGPAAWWFDWAADDYDRLAGAVVAGHVLECGTQATGGNYSFFTAHDVRRPGFPLAEISEDGSSVITKHPGTGGAVTTGTVTAQLLYETQGVRYLGPDVTARLDTVRLAGDGPDRVRVSGVLGEPPPACLKAGVTRIGGWRNEVVFVLTGLDIEAKGALVRAQLSEALDGVADAAWTLARTDHEDAPTEETASALLRLVVRDPSPDRVGRALTSAAVELALGSYPGFHVTAPPGPAQPYGVFTSALVPAAVVPHTAVLPDGTRLPVSAARGPSPTPPLPGCAVFAATAAWGGSAPRPPSRGSVPDPSGAPPPDPRASNAGEAVFSAPPAFEERGPGRSPGISAPSAEPAHPAPPAFEARGSGGGAPEGVRGGVPAGSGGGAPGATRRAPLGAVAGARSGDKGGDANIGVWVESDAAWHWLDRTLTVERLQELLPETRAHAVHRHSLPNLRALNFTVTGILGDGVASGHRFDPQAKALGEWLRARHLDIPAHLLPEPAAPEPAPETAPEGTGP